MCEYGYFITLDNGAVAYEGDAVQGTSQKLIDVNIQNILIKCIHISACVW